MPRHPPGWCLFINKQVVATYEELKEFDFENEVDMYYWVDWFHQKKEAGQLPNLKLDVLQEQILFGYLQGLKEAQRIAAASSK